MYIRDIEVIITIDRKDIETYRKEFIEFNHYNPTDEELLEEYEELFYADCREYINDIAEVEMKIKED